MEFVEGEPERYYRVLVDDETGRLETEQIRHRLRSGGINVDKVLADTPSYQSIRTHLTDCLGMDTSNNKGRSPSPARIEDTIRALQKRTERVVAGSIARLRGDDRNDPETLDIHVDITVMCECGRSRSVFTLLRDGCNCRT
jgi:hypothetical protein